MLDQLIKEKVNTVSYSQTELSNIATTLTNLKSIINNQPDFENPFLGGSYKRATMVKNVSDVDVYFKYTGIGNSQSALTTLKNSLKNSYPSTIIRQDIPSILADFNKIPINITPYKEDNFGNLSIPDKYHLQWTQINFGQLEAYIIALRQKNCGLIDLIKILKLWNKNYNRGIKNFEIEKKVCNIFLYNHLASSSISDWLYTFFYNHGFQNDANKIFSLMKMNSDQAKLKGEWLNFIDKR